MGHEAVLLIGADLCEESSASFSCAIFALLWQWHGGEAQLMREQGFLMPIQKVSASSVIFCALVIEAIGDRGEDCEEAFHLMSHQLLLSAHG